MPSTRSPKSPREPIVCPFTIIVDTREQAPYDFKNYCTDADQGYREMVVLTHLQALPSGDYSIRGFENRIAIERKSKEDLFGTLGSGRERFIRELERLNKLDAAWVIIEATEPDIHESPPERSRLNPKTISRSISAWELEFPRIHWRFMGSRNFAEATTLRILERFWKVVNSQQPTADH